MNSLGDGLIIAFYGIVFLLGLVGNSLIIFTTCKYRKRQSVMNVFMLSLASSDLLLIIVCIPFKVETILSNVWQMGEIMCKGVHFTQSLFAICSVMTLAAISLERYYAIIHPMKARYICTVGNTKRVILGIWLLSPVLAIPSILLFNEVPFGRKMRCVGNASNDFFWRFHELYIALLILVIPLSIMTFCYTIICYELWGKLEARSIMTNQQALKRTISISRNKSVKPTKKESQHTNQDKQMVKQITRKLITVVIVFAVCWTPLLVVNLLMAYEILPFFKVNYLKYLSIVFSLMAYTNSCLNPIVYGFMSKAFRRRFFALFKNHQTLSPNQGKGLWLI